MKMSDNEDNNKEIRRSLAAIAYEMQKLCNEPSNENEFDKINNILKTLVKYKRKLNLKRDQIKLLGRNLKTTCIVAKTLSIRNGTASASLNNELNNARNQNWNLVKQLREKTNLVNILRAEIQTLRDKLECYNNFIALGYKDLQNQREEYTEENISSLTQLQRIILRCGQYHSNYRDQIEKCAQLQQKNRFLNSKLRILEGHLEATVEKVRHCRCVNGIKHIEKRRNESQSQLCTNLGVVCSEYQIGCDKNITNLKMIKIELNKGKLLTNDSGLDLTQHFNTVKQLLHDQDSIIEDLKCLSNELNLQTFLG